MVNQSLIELLQKVKLAIHPIVACPLVADGKIADEDIVANWNNIAVKIKQAHHFIKDAVAIMQHQAEQPQDMVERVANALKAAYDSVDSHDHLSQIDAERMAKAAIAAMVSYCARPQNDKIDTKEWDASARKDEGCSATIAPPAKALDVPSTPPDSPKPHECPVCRTSTMRESDAQITERIHVPAGYALVRLDCTLPKLADEQKGFLWVTADEVKNARYDFDKDGYAMPIYYVKSTLSKSEEQGWRG